MAKRAISRRQALQTLTAAAASTFGRAFADGAATNPAQSLAAIAAEKGILFGASFAVHELDAPHGPAYEDLYARETHILTSELEFKMASLRPTPDKIDFYDADRLVEFAEAHAMRVR